MSGTLADVAAALGQKAPSPSAMPALGLAWYVVRSHPNQEFRASKGITADIGFPVFLPIERRYVVHARQKKVRDSSLLGAYFFVAFDVRRDAWMEILEVDGVADVLRNGLRPSRVEDQSINDLKQAVEMGLFDETVGSHLKPGARVIVPSHEGLGLAMRIKSVTKDKRAEIVYELLGREVSTILPLDRIRPA